MSLPPYGWGSSGPADQDAPTWGQQDPAAAYLPPPGGHHGGGGGGQGRKVIIAVAAAAAVLLGAIGVLVMTLAADDDAQVRVPSGETISVFDLEVGQCLTLDHRAEELDQVGLVSCAQPHTAEVYAVIDHTAPIGAPFPGEEEVSSFADEECLVAFAGYVGVRYEASEIYSTSLFPTAESWSSSGDREVVCLLVTGDGSPLDPGSLEGAGI